jgi:multidrug efflux system outer membrane protein
MKISKIIYGCLLTAGVVAVSGCSSLKPVKSPDTLQPEASFTGTTDSVTIAQIKWKDFFKDPLLVDLIDTALKNNYDLKKAVQRIEMAQAALMYRQGALLPVVTAEGSGGVRKFGEYTMDGVGNYDTNFSTNIGPDKHIDKHLQDYFLGLRSSWEIDIWGKLRKQKEAAAMRFLATEKGRQLITTSLIAQVGRLYYELLALDNELMIVRRNEELQGKAVETIKIQKEGGRANELAVRQFVAQYLNTQALEAQKLQQIVELENQLNALLGRFPQPIRRGHY